MRGEAVELFVRNAKLVRGEPKEDLAHPLRRHPRASENGLEAKAVDERDESVRDLIRGRDRSKGAICRPGTHDVEVVAPPTRIGALGRSEKLRPLDDPAPELE
jgi:hypothetical protein